MADVRVAAIEDLDSLSPSQRLRFVIYLMVARSKMPTSDGALLDVKSTEAFARFWELRRHQLRPELSDYIDAREEAEYAF